MAHFYFHSREVGLSGEKTKRIDKTGHSVKKNVGRREVREYLQYMRGYLYDSSRQPGPAVQGAALFFLDIFPIFEASPEEKNIFDFFFTDSESP